MTPYQTANSPGRTQRIALSAAARRAQLDTLTQVNTDDLLGAFGLHNVRGGRFVLHWLCRVPARRFAQKVITYDDLVGSDGLQTGGAWAVKNFVDHLAIDGATHVPTHGPVLIVANHPGLCDTTALFAAIARPDLRVVAASRAFLRALPNTSRHLLYVDETAPSRLSAIRAVARHLRDGGAVLTFPAGQIEPDPAVLPGAVAALDRWSSSIEVFARFAHNITIVPAIVSGVLSPAALRHPLTYLRRKPVDRQWLAALLQIQNRALQHVTVRVSFGQPITCVDGDGSNAALISHAVKAEARRLIEQVQPV